jgi:hypothetical protein
LARRSDDAGENLLTVGTSPGAIAATDLSRDDRRADRVLGAPVRRVDRRIEQERPDGGEFALEMRGETLDVRHATRTVEPTGEAGDQLPAARSIFTRDAASADVLTWVTRNFDLIV